MEQLEPRQMLTAVANGQELAGSFDVGGSDSYELTAEAGDLVRFAVGETGGLAAEPVIEILGPDGLAVVSDSGNSNAIVQFTATQNGTYTAMVSDAGDDEAMQYQIRAIAVPDLPQLIAGRDSTLGNGEELTSALPLGSFNVHTFSADSGNLVRLSLAETGGLAAEPTIQVIGPDGQIVDSNSGNSEALLQFVAAQSGDYTLLVGDSSSDEAMSYRLRSIVVPEVPQLLANRDSALANGEELESDFPLGSYNLHTLEVDSGDLVRLTLGETGGMAAEPVVQLVAPDGQVVETGSGNVDAGVQFTATQTGTYLAIISDSGNDEGMEYRVRAITVPDTPQLIAGRDQVLQNGEEYAGSIPLGTFNLHTMAVDSGDLVRIAIGELGGLAAEPVLQVVGPDGQVVDSASGNVEALVQFTATQTGTFTLIVSDSSSDEPIDYRIRAIAVPDVPQLIAERDSALENGGELTSSLPLGSFNIHTFAAESGNLVRLSMGEIGGLAAEPAMQVVAPDGQVVESASGTIDAVVQFTATQTGTFTLIVSDSANDEPLDYRLRSLVAPATPQLLTDRDSAPANTQVVATALPLGSFNLHTFELGVGQSAQVMAWETGGLAAEPVVQIIGPDGQVIEQVAGNSEARARFTALQAGTYLALVSDNNNDEALEYQLSVISPPPIFGDADNDYAVAGSDLLAVTNNFGSVGRPDGWLLGDADDDGTVSGSDLLAVTNNFGSTLPAASFAADEAFALYESPEQEAASASLWFDEPVVAPVEPQPTLLELPSQRAETESEWEAWGDESDEPAAALAVTLEA